MSDGQDAFLRKSCEAGGSGTLLLQERVAHDQAGCRLVSKSQAHQATQAHTIMGQPRRKHSGANQRMSTCIAKEVLE